MNFSVSIQIIVVAFQNYFTLTTFMLFTSSLVVIYQTMKHVNQISSIQLIVIEGNLTKILTLVSFALPLVLVSLNLGIAAGVKGDGEPLKDAFSSKVAYYGGNKPSFLARFWPANETLYYGMILPISLSLLFDILLAMLVLTRLKHTRICSVSFCNEFRLVVSFVILVSVTFGFGYLGAELRNHSMHDSTVLQWFFVTFKWSWMFLLGYWALYTRKDVWNYAILKKKILETIF